MDLLLKLGPLHRRIPVWFRCLFRRGLALRVPRRPRRPPVPFCSSLLPLRSILGQHSLLVAIFCSIAITYSIAHTLSSGTRKCKHIMTLFSFLFYICAYHNIMFWPSILTVLTIIRLTLSLVFRSTSSWQPVPCLPAFCQRLQDLYP